MLENFVLSVDYGVSYGSVTLKSLQNDNVPELDLLVREAIQNSSDASLKEDASFFVVNFSTGTFCPPNFNFYMTGIESYLNDRFPGDNAHFLEIRDVKTSGLTGCIRKKDIKKEDHGNFFKLIYDTGKRQSQTGAGGNWGFGKSVYYRVGVGIVVFYSRIKSDNGYESRLIVTVVEDEGRKNPDGSDATILNRLNTRSAGKAWWGIREGEDLLPISDEEFIASLLDVFGLKPFQETETGTSVIIPYIDPEKLLKDTIPADVEMESGARDHFATNWTSTLDDYLRLSIQRWYAPKIHNRELTKYTDKKWLYAAVNDAAISKQNMLPLFQLIQELYTTAMAKNYGSEYRSDLFPQIKCLPVNIQKYFEGGTTSGFVAAIKITRSDLNGTQNVLSPYVYIGKFEAAGGKNEPVVMYARDPGMIVSYSVNGPWVKGISEPEDQDEFLFAFYVPASGKHLRTDLPVPEYAGMSLGEYLRACEASDHMAWNDPAKMQLVTRIQKNTANQIENKIVKSAEIKVEATASKLAAKLGRSLLPRIGYGKKKAKTEGGGNGGAGRSGSLKNCEFEIQAITVRGNEIEIPFKLKLFHGKRAASIDLVVGSEGGWITPVSWEKDIGTHFPATIERFVVETVASNVDPEPQKINNECSAEKLMFTAEKVSAELICAEESRELTSVRIDSHILNMEISGVMKIRAYDRKYQFSIKVE